MYARIESLESRQLLSDGNTTFNIGDTKFFVQRDSAHGSELWKSDLDGSNAALIKDINPGDRGSYPTWLTEESGTLLFVASDNTHGAELWRSDGTDAGTYIVKELRSGIGGSYVKNLFAFNGKVFFVAEADRQYQLYSTDGTSEGTKLLTVSGIPPQNDVGVIQSKDGSLFIDVYDQSSRRLDRWQLNADQTSATLYSDSGIFGRQLAIYSTDAAETIRISSAGGITSVEISGRANKSFDNASFDTVALNTLDGHDTVTLDQSVAQPITMTGNGGNDSLRITGNGADILTAENGQVHVDGTDGDDVIIFGGGSLVFNGVSRRFEDVAVSHLTVNGGAGNDSLDINCSDATPVVHGNDGDDTISLKNWDPRRDILDNVVDYNKFFLRGTVYGDAGNDTLVGNSDVDDYHGGDGVDLIDFGNRAFGSRYIWNSTYHRWYYTAGGSSINPGIKVSLDDVANDGHAGSANVHSDIEQVIGSQDKDTLVAGIGPTTLFGGNGNDTLIGVGGDDSLDGGTGNNTIQQQEPPAPPTPPEPPVVITPAAQIVNKVLTIIGTAAADQFRITYGVGAFNLVINGVTSTQPYNAFTSISIDGLAGNDTIHTDGIAYPCRIFGGAGNDIIYGSQAADRISGGDGNDWINAGAGNDTLYGDAGNDRVFGGTGKDSIYAEAGDVVRAGEDKDRIIGRISKSDRKANIGDLILDEA